MSTTTLNNQSSDKEQKLISKQEYRSVLRKHLSSKDFNPDAKELLHYSIFMFLYLFGIYSLVTIQLLPIKIFISIFMGISLAALTFFST